MNPAGTLRVGGFPTNIFVNGFDRKYQCCNCKSVLREPMQSYCEHRFCRSCIDFLTKMRTEEGCQGCKDGGEDTGPEFLNKVFEDTAVRREMATLPVECVNLDCKWKGKFQEYEVHEQVCLYRLYTCECGKTMKISEQAHHAQDECPYRKVICQYCTNVYQYNEIRPHHDVCSKFPVTCEACNQTSIPRDKMLVHSESQCPLKTMLCPLGCNQLIAVDALRQHMSSDTTAAVHLSAINKKLVVMDSKMTGLEFEGSENASSGARSKVPSSVIKSQLSQIDERITAVEGKAVRTEQLAAVVALKQTNTIKTELTHAIKTLRERLEFTEKACAVLYREFNKGSDQLVNIYTSFETKKAADKTIMTQQEQKIRSLEKLFAVQDATIADLSFRLESSELSSYNGDFVWRIPEFSQKCHDAVGGRVTSLYSPAFYTSQFGYKMCIRLYPNGDGMGKSTHMSLFFVVMRGNYDALLRWPFRQKVTLMLMDQNGRDHVVDAFRPDPNSASFKRPMSDMNIASGCPLFVSLQTLGVHAGRFVQDDVIYIKVTVDCSDL